MLVAQVWHCRRAFLPLRSLSLPSHIRSSGTLESGEHLMSQSSVSLFSRQVRDYWARNVSPNKNIKVYIGGPGSSMSAGSGYVDAPTLSKIATETRSLFPSFGGVMLWDMSSSYGALVCCGCILRNALIALRPSVNNRFDQSIKQALVAAGGTGFTFPECDAPQFVQGNNYPGGSNVTYNKCVWVYLLR